jgi:hypothetical protein
MASPCTGATQDVLGEPADAAERPMVTSMLPQPLPHPQPADPKAPAPWEDMAPRPRLATAPPQDMLQTGRITLTIAELVAAQSSRTKTGAK